MIEQRLYAHLSANADLSALVASRIYPLVIPQGASLPALVYQRISGVPANHAGRVPTLESARVQINCYAQRYGQVKDLRDAVIAALEQPSAYFQCTRLAERDLYDDEDRTYALALDFSFWHHRS